MDNILSLEQRASLQAIYITGTTASGKSALALEVAKRLGGEIISVDSMQVYRGLDIGTDKISLKIRESIPHYLIDIREIEEQFDAASFITEASSAVKKIQSCGKIPIFCGGTGMYFKIWLEGLASVPPPSDKIRERLSSLSLEELQKILLQKDPASAQKIDLKNRRRLERALEIFLITGKSASLKNISWKGYESDTKPFLFILQREKEELIRRINLRVERMFEQGLVEETCFLLKQGLEKNKTAMQAIGYRQIAAYLRGEIKSLSEAKEEIKIRTRQFAKRQRTWFRGQMGYGETFTVSEQIEKLAKEIEQKYYFFIEKSQKKIDSSLC